MPIITPSTNGIMPEVKKEDMNPSICASVCSCHFPSGRFQVSNQQRADTHHGVFNTWQEEKDQKADIKPAEKAPPYDPDIPEPNSRAELMKFWMNISLDDRTAQKTLWLSEGGAKVSRMSEEVCPVLDRPERYEYSPQVLCKEGVLGNRGYWEVDCKGWVVLGAVCESTGRKTKDGPCGIGENDLSWGVGWAGSCYHVWHNGENIEIQAPLCPTIGIYADQPAGIIKFYLVEDGENGSKQVRLVHRFKTTINEKLYPGFWVGRKSYCWIRKKDQ